MHWRAALSGARWSAIVFVFESDVNFVGRGNQFGPDNFGSIVGSHGVTSMPASSANFSILGSVAESQRRGIAREPRISVLRLGWKT